MERQLLRKYPTKEMTVRQIKENEWLVETTTEDQSNVYQSINELENIEITVKKHDQLNSIEGTVILPPNNTEDGLPQEQVMLKSLQSRYNNLQNSSR